MVPLTIPQPGHGGELSDAALRVAAIRLIGSQLQLLSIDQLVSIERIITAAAHSPATGEVRHG